MLRALLLSLAAATASVVAVAVPSSLQSSQALVTGQDEWHITTKNVPSERPLSHDTHLEYINLVNCHGMASAGVNYPVLVHLPSRTTFWALSWIDREAFTIVGLNSSGSIVNAVYAPGARYVCGIKFVDSRHHDVAFVGQGGVAVIVSRQQLLNGLAQPTRMEIEPAALRLGALWRRQDEPTAPTEPPPVGAPPTEPPPIDTPPVTEPPSPGSTDPTPTISQPSPDPTEPPVSTPVDPTGPSTTDPSPVETTSPDPSVPTGPSDSTDPPVVTTTTPILDPSESGTPAPTVLSSFTQSASSPITQSPSIESQPTTSPGTGPVVPPTTTDAPTSSSTPPPLPPPTKTHTPPPPLTTETPPIASTETLPASSAPAPTPTGGGASTGTVKGTGTTTASVPEITTGNITTSSIKKVISALQLCAECSEKPCEYTDLQRLNTQSYRVLVGTPQSNCDGSKSSLDAELNVSETVSDTWGLSTTAANSVGIYRTGVEFGKTNWTETRGRAVTQNTKIKINPGQKARFVASVQYDVSEGTLVRGGKAIGKLVSNQPKSVHSFTVQVVSCLGNFVGEELNVPPRANCKASNAAPGQSLPATRRSIILGLGIWTTVVYMLM